MGSELALQTDRHVGGRQVSYVHVCMLRSWNIDASAAVRTVPDEFCPSMSLCVPKPCEHHISTTNEGNFTQFWPQMCLGSQMCWLDFGVKRSKAEATAGGGITVDGSRRVPSSFVWYDVGWDGPSVQRNLCLPAFVWNYRCKTFIRRINDVTNAFSIWKIIKCFKMVNKKRCLQNVVCKIISD